MYSEYESIFNSIQYNDLELYDLNGVFSKIRSDRPRPVSVLTNCSPEVIEQVLNNYNAALKQPYCLNSGKDIKSIMSVMSESFNLALSKHDLIEKCVNIYTDWLTQMFLPKSDQSTNLVQILNEDRNYLTATILSHFMRLFQSRKGEPIEFLKFQEAMCNKILNLMKKLANDSTVFDNEIWEYFLIFLMGVNRQLLVPLTLGNDLADHLCENLLIALFEIWILACANYFPAPSFWKSFNETCINLRHRLPLIEQWNRINFALTSRLLCFLYGNTYPGVKISNEINLIPNNMSNDCIAQTWYRFFCCIGNPVELCKPEIIFKTIIYYKMVPEDKLIKYLMEHPTLKAFPLIYWKAMEGLAKLVNAFLGMPFEGQTSSSKKRLIDKPELFFERGKETTKQTQWFFSSSFINTQGAIDSNIPSEQRSHCNSILHLFGKVLFEAAFLNRDIFMEDSQKRSSHTIKYNNYYQNIQSPLFEYFDAGQAEIIGAICRILCAKKVSEEIMPIYLSRFYLSLSFSIKLAQVHTFLNLDRLISNSLATILLNSSDLFRLNLKGVDVLFPCLVEALESVFNENVKFRLQTSKNSVRKAAIQLLMSMVIRPITLYNLKIQELVSKEVIKYECYKCKMYDILTNALDKEKSANNIFMLLSAILLYLEELVIFQKNATLFRSVERSVSEMFLDINLKICTNLVTIWKSDLNISLATLEFLSGLAHIKIPDYEQHSFDKETVRYLCEYIIYQCSRRPPAHSKDLHSTIVSAFYCCISWLMEYPRILDDKEYFHIIMEIIELGISGTKSVDRINSNICMKHEKDLKPVSLRVKDAAEYLLNCILERIGHCPSKYGVDSLSSLMDEVSLLKNCNTYSGTLLNRKKAIEQFQYFILDSSTILALLDEPLGNDQDSNPVVTVLIRNTFSRFAWTMQLRHLPRTGSCAKHYNSMSGRPVWMTSPPTKSSVTPKYYPEHIDKLTPCEIDFSIPSMESVSRRNPIEFNEISKISKLMEKQVTIESKLINDCDSNRLQNFECVPPKCNLEYQSIRLFLANFNLLPLSLDKKKDPCDDRLKALNCNSIGFCNDLEILDAINSRIFDTVYLFYAAKGAKTVEEILTKRNADQKIFDKFTSFIQNLGVTVLIENHCGWTGNIRTSWKTSLIKQECDKTKPDNVRNLADGFSNILYWSDAVSEIAFICPSLESAGDVFDIIDTSEVKSAFLNDTNLRNLSMSQSNAKFFLVWLERFEDHSHFPTDELLNFTKTGLEIGSASKSPEIFVIFVYLMDSGLVRVHVKSPTNRTNSVIPLMDGAVVSKNTFSFMIRQYVLNVSKRQRLDNDSYQTPHVRRRIKIQEILQKYKQDMSAPELLTYLFQK